MRTIQIEAATTSVEQVMDLAARITKAHGGSWTVNDALYIALVRGLDQMKGTYLDEAEVTS